MNPQAEAACSTARPVATFRKVSRTIRVEPIRMPERPQRPAPSPEQPTRRRPDSAPDTPRRARRARP